MHDFHFHSPSGGKSQGGKKMTGILVFQQILMRDMKRRYIAEIVSELNLVLQIANLKYGNMQRCDSSLSWHRADIPAALKILASQLADTSTSPLKLMKCPNAKPRNSGIAGSVALA
jgi:hypothetical protein